MIDAGYDGLTTGLHRVNALLSWWGVSHAGDDREIESEIARFERFTAHLQQACRETHSRQLATALSTKAGLACLVQDLARCQRPNDVTAVESAIVATLLDAAVAQAKMWTELAGEIQASWRAMTREANARVDGNVGDGASQRAHLKEVHGAAGDQALRCAGERLGDLLEQS